MAIHVSFRLAISHEAIIITNRSSEPCGLVLQSMILYSHEIIANSFRAQHQNYDMTCWINMDYYVAMHVGGSAIGS